MHRLITLRLVSVLFFREKKLKGNNQRAQSFHNFSHFFHNFSRFFRIFPPGLSPSKQRVSAQGEQKRETQRYNKKNGTNRFCTFVVARLSSSCAFYI